MQLRALDGCIDRNIISDSFTVLGRSSYGSGDS